MFDSTLLSVEFHWKTTTCFGNVVGHVLVATNHGPSIAVFRLVIDAISLFVQRHYFFKKQRRKTPQFYVPGRKINIQLDHRNKSLTETKERIVLIVVTEPVLSRLLGPHLVLSKDVQK